MFRILVSAFMFLNYGMAQTCNDNTGTVEIQSICECGEVDLDQARLILFPSMEGTIEVGMVVLFMLMVRITHTKVMEIHNVSSKLSMELIRFDFSKTKLLTTIHLK